MDQGWKIRNKTRYKQHESFAGIAQMYFERVGHGKRRDKDKFNFESESDYSFGAAHSS